MKKFILLTLALAVCMTVNAETYTWAVPSGWAWDTNIVWSPLDIANSNKYPNGKGDIAIINTLVTNSSGNYQIWPNQFGHMFTTIGEFQLNMTNELTFGAGGDFNAMVFETDTPPAKFEFNNLYINESNPGWWWNHGIDIRFDTSYILSNDLILFAEGPLDSYGDKDSAYVWVVDDAQFFGDHSLTKEGEGRFIVGAFYGDTLEYSEPDFKLTQPIYVNNGSFEPNHGAKFASPVYLQEGTNYAGFYRQYSDDDVDIDLVFNGGAYVANYGSITHNTNHGDITVLSQADFYLSAYGGNIRHAVLDGDIKGTNWVVQWWGGDLFCAGSVSPGMGGANIGTLSFYSDETNTVRIGSPDRQVDLNIDVNGADSDLLVIDTIFDFTLTNLNLKLNVSNADINATNLIVYSFDAGAGVNISQFNSVTIQPAGATGTLIYYTDAVEITDIQIPGEFIVNTNLIEFGVGETQKFVTLTAPYITTTTNTVIEGTNWISVAAQTFLTSNSVDVAINIPLAQTVGDTGTVRFTSIEMPTETYDVQIKVVPEATTIGLIIFACIFSLYHGKRN